MAILTISTHLAKRVSKSLAPNFLRWSLHIHEIIASKSPLSKSLPNSLINSLSLLPLAQRIVSIEVQDDYHQLKKSGGVVGSSSDGSIANQISKSFDNFVNQTWNLFFENRHQRLKLEEEEREKQLTMAVEKEIEKEVQRRRIERERHRRKNTKIADTKATRGSKARQIKTNQTGNEFNNDEELIQLGEKRVQVLEQYVRKALLPTESWRDFERPLFSSFSHLPHPQLALQSQSSNSQTSSKITPQLQPVEQDHSYDSFVKWLRGEYLVAKYGLFVQRAVRIFPELRDDAAGFNSIVPGTQSVNRKNAREVAEIPMDNILPSVDVVKKAFGMDGWNVEKVPLNEFECESNHGSSEADASTQKLRVEEILHDRLKGQISHSGPLNAYFEMRRREDSYELWTKEYIFGLATYLLERIEEMNRADETGPSKSPTETIILDVGAGDGRLVYFLRRAMKGILSSQGKQMRKGRRNYNSSKTLTDTQTSSLAPTGVKMPTIIATDDGSWNAPIYNNKHIQVEALSAVAALDKYGPSLALTHSKSTDKGEKRERKSRLIVICSWMPPGQDFTADFRRCSLMKNAVEASGDEASGELKFEKKGMAEEYILIGECDDGTCGHNWYTWGNPNFYPHDDSNQIQSLNEKNNDQVEEGNGVPIPPYVKDGYTRIDLEELSRLQISRFDCKRSSESRTVSFRRQ